MPAEVLILGGGVIGLTTAYYLAREGTRVAVLDKGEFGREASWAGAGILPPAHLKHARSSIDRLRALSFEQFPSLSQELKERTGIDNGFVRSGGLEFLGPHGEAAAEEWRGEGVVCESLDESGIARLEPQVARGHGPAVFLPEMAQLRNPRHLKALLAGCRSLAVELHPGCSVHGFQVKGSRITAFKTLAGPVAGDRFLLAGGAWTDSLLEGIGISLGIQPVRGQIALLHTEASLFNRILLWGPRYLVPRPDGRVLVGSTEEKAGFDKRTTSEAIAGLLSLANQLVPGLGQASLERCWAGLRPGSPDGLPFLGLVPGFENLFVAAGHFRAGIQLSLGTGQCMAECLRGKPPTLPLHDFRPDRFRG